MMVGQFTPQFKANGDIRPFRFVSFEATGVDMQVVESNANDKQVVGITTGDNKAFDNANHAEAGDGVILQPGLVMRLEAGGALDAGDLIEPDANGLGIVAVPAVGVGYAFARALEDASGINIILWVYWLGMTNVNEAVS